MHVHIYLRKFISTSDKNNYFAELIHIFDKCTCLHTFKIIILILTKTEFSFNVIDRFKRFNGICIPYVCMFSLF